MVDLLQLRMCYRGHTKKFPIFYSSDTPNRIGCGATRYLPILVTNSNLYSVTITSTS